MHRYIFLRFSCINFEVVEGKDFFPFVSEVHVIRMQGFLICFLIFFEVELLEDYFLFSITFLLNFEPLV